ncbi:hypothetical protein [Thalassobius sp. MITS945101]|uniref:hypothetical protein n=1 Tax=Thalassobius sp. MITS945101 TaxID=3096994 RepID=UPI00399BF154
MKTTPLIAPFLADAPPLLVFLLTLSVLILPILAVVAALMRLREPDGPKSAWSCVMAAVLLFLTWLVPPNWLDTIELRQLRDFAAIGLYAWVLFDWFRSGRDHGWAPADVVVILAIIWMVGLAGWGLSY